MAKAQITMPDGMSVKIDGTPAEIVKLVADLKKEGGKSPTTKRGRSKSVRTSLPALIESLSDGDFFKKPRGLAEVKSALAEMGHHYPVTTLSGAMLDQVRRRNLRRLKTNKVWAYAR